MSQPQVQPPPKKIKAYRVDQSLKWARDQPKDAPAPSTVSPVGCLWVGLGITGMFLYALRRPQSNP